MSSASPFPTKVWVGWDEEESIAVVMLSESQAAQWAVFGPPRQVVGPVSLQGFPILTGTIIPAQYVLQEQGDQRV